jgi:hypothetical protein
MIASFNHFEIVLTKKQATQGGHVGRCDEDIAALLEVPAISRQLDQIDPEDLSAELKEFGAWTPEELAVHEDNRRRILWIACGQIAEEERSRK